MQCFRVPVAMTVPVVGAVRAFQCQLFATVRLQLWSQWPGSLCAVQYRSYSTSCVVARSFATLSKRGINSSPTLYDWFVVYPLCAIVKCVNSSLEKETGPKGKLTVVLQASCPEHIILSHLCILLGSLDIGACVPVL